MYAPVTLSGVVIGFNVDRIPGDSAGAEEEQDSGGIAWPSLNLTPRLVAKLLTQSYSFQVIGRTPLPPDYTWVDHEPDDLGGGPRVPEVQSRVQACCRSGSGRNFAGLVLPARDATLTPPSRCGSGSSPIPRPRRGWTAQPDSGA